jgi:hypothetical protein
MRQVKWVDVINGHGQLIMDLEGVAYDWRKDTISKSTGFGSRYEKVFVCPLERPAGLGGARVFNPKVPGSVFLGVKAAV